MVCIERISYPSFVSSYMYSEKHSIVIIVQSVVSNLQFHSIAPCLKLVGKKEKPNGSAVANSPRMKRNCETKSARLLVKTNV
jgi:hypothetical protein